MPYEMQIFSLYVGGVQYEETFFFGACACYVLMPRSVFQRRGALRARGADDRRPGIFVHQLRPIRPKRGDRDRVSRGNRRRRDRGGNEGRFRGTLFRRLLRSAHGMVLRPPERRRGRRLVFRRYARGKISRRGACLYALHL